MMVEPFRLILLTGANIPDFITDDKFIKINVNFDASPCINNSAPGIESSAGDSETYAKH